VNRLPPARVAVLGPGGVGGLVAALLARRGDQVTCLAPPATAAALAANGLELRSPALVTPGWRSRPPPGSTTRSTSASSP
jgi:ketopantoate reductase